MRGTITRDTVRSRTRGILTSTDVLRVDSGYEPVVRQLMRDLLAVVEQRTKHHEDQQPQTDHRDDEQLQHRHVLTFL